MSYQVVHDEIRKSILILLRPLVRINFILGTCPCLISPEGQIKTPFKYFNFCRFFLIVGLLIFLSVSPLIRGCVSMITSSKNNEYLGKNYFAEVKSEVVGVTLTKYVDVACGFYANMIPAVFLCLACFKRKQILSFFDTMTKYVNRIRGFGDYEHIKRATTRLFIMHGVFGVTMSSLLAMRFVSNSETTYGPGTMALWVMHKEGSFLDPQWILWITAPFFAYLSVAKTAVTAFIDVCCVSLACCFCKVIQNIQIYLNEVMASWNRSFLDDALPTRVLMPRKVHDAKDNRGMAHKIHKDFENYLEQVRNRAGLQLSVGNDDHERSIHIRGDFCDFRQTTPGQQILFVIDKFQTVRNMQTAANRLFGSVLALHTGFTVFMCVVLKYMLIWNFGNLMKKSQESSNNGEVENGTSVPGDYRAHPSWNDTTRIVNAGIPKNPFVTNTLFEWTLLGMLDICFSVRLFVLVIFLGNVHYTSLKFNSKLSQALLQAQKIADVIELQGMSNKFFKGRQVMTQSEANTVLGFITENSANPMAFSAAGLFCFSRNLILVILSIIITYLVFLLQV